MKRLLAIGGFLAVAVTATLAFANPWNSNQAFQPYRANWVKLAAGGAPSPVFDVDLGTSITPTVGTAGTYTRNSTDFYYDSSTSVSSKTANSPRLPAFQIGVASGDGMQFDPAGVNYLVQSEAPATAPWAAVGLGVAVDDVDLLFSTIRSGTVTSVLANDGIEQDTGITIGADQYMIFSVYASVAAGTEGCKLHFEGGTVAGTVTKSVTVTDTPQRFFFYRENFGTATGNLKVKFTIDDAATTVNVGGFMLEPIFESGHSGGYWHRSKRESSYIKTVAATVTRAADALSYAGTELTALQNEYTACVWFNTLEADTENGGGSKQLISWNAGVSSRQDGLRYYPQGSVQVALAYLDGVNYELTWNGTPTVGSVWEHYCLASKRSTSSYRFCRAGVCSDPDSAGGSEPAALHTWSYLRIGEDANGNSSNAWNSVVIGRVQVFDEQLSDSEIDALYDAQKASYGL